MHVVEFVPSASVIVIGGERYVIFSLQHPLTRLDALIISTSHTARRVVALPGLLLPGRSVTPESCAARALCADIAVAPTYTVRVCRFRRSISLPSVLQRAARASGR